MDWDTETLCKLEANIDDMSGEVAGYLTEKLLDGGSLDAWTSPAFMKKGRPAYTVHVLCHHKDQEELLRLLFSESTTLGVRKYSVERCSLRRKVITSSTALGDVRVKVRTGRCHAEASMAATNSPPPHSACRARAQWPSLRMHPHVRQPCPLITCQAHLSSSSISPLSECRVTHVHHSAS